MSAINQKWITIGMGSNNVPIVYNSTLTKGTYAVVITYIAPSNNQGFWWPVVMDNSTGDNINSSFTWTKSNSNWNLTEFPADLPFYFNFISLDNNNIAKPLTYSDPNQINFNILDQ